MFISKAMIFHFVEHMADLSQPIIDVQLQNIHAPENDDV